MKQGLREVVKSIWETDISDWNQFLKDQDNNGNISLLTFL